MTHPHPARAALPSCIVATVAIAALLGCADRTATTPSSDATSAATALDPTRSPPSHSRGEPDALTERTRVRVGDPGLERLDPSEVYAVPIDGDPFQGPADAKVILVMAYDYGCSFCLRAQATLEQLARDYGDDLKIVYKSLVAQPSATTIPALAACAAARQDAFRPMNERIWARGFEAGRDFSPGNMIAIAADLGLDLERFQADLHGEDCKHAIEADRALLMGLGVRVTPTFFINGRPLTGALPIDLFRRVIDRELRAVDDALAGGATLERYYEDRVVKAGKTSI